MNYIVSGLGFGDEGKGITVANIVNRLINDNKRVSVVRSGGGPQNAHNVHWFSGNSQKRHCFSQIGSAGNAAGDVKSFTLSAVPVNIPALAAETVLLSQTLGIRADSLLKNNFLSGNSLAVLPINVMVSRIRESAVKHGSQGCGIFEVNKFAETYPDSAITLSDLSGNSLYDKLKEFMRWVNSGMPDRDGTAIIQRDQFKFVSLDREIDGISRLLSDIKPFLNILSDDEMIESINKSENLVFENGQGVLLDKDFGFFPNVTFSSALPNFAANFIEKNITAKERRVFGVLRTYVTRHGAGILPAEDPALELVAESYHDSADIDKNSVAGKMRYAPLCADTFNYATELFVKNGIPLTDIVFTHCDFSTEICAVTYDFNIAKRFDEFSDFDIPSHMKMAKTAVEFNEITKRKIPRPCHLKLPENVFVHRNSSMFTGNIKWGDYDN
jgi:adenylosuccinate synthase